MMRRGRGSSLLLSVVLTSALAHAHRGSDAYWRLHLQGAVLEGQLEVSLVDAAALLQLSRDGESSALWSEVNARQAQLTQLLSRNLIIKDCALHFGVATLIHHQEQPYVSVSTHASCPSDAQAVEVHYQLLFDLDARHRGLLSLDGHWQAFTSQTRTHRVALAPLSASAQWWVALEQGFHHLATGWDHLCFLLALLLPAVLRRENQRWVPRSSWKETALAAAKIVTAFTVAHSLTLGLASFGVVTPPSAAIELAIALSVAVAALNNLVPVVREAHWALAFALGLLHGFGFVSAIQDLGAARLWLSVVGFNVGIEVGQLLMVVAFVALVWRMRSTTVYRQVLVPLGSAVLLGISLIWVQQRLRDL